MLALGCKALAYMFSFFGLPVGLALAIGCLARVLITEEVSEVGGLRMIPAGSDSSNSGNWRDYLNLSPDNSVGGGSNEPAAENPPAPQDPVFPVQEQLGIQNPAEAEPYPYADDEVIGGDSVNTILRRLLGRHPPFPPSEVIDFCRIEARDLMEVKAEIIQKMAPWDQGGDWLGRGARALDNPRTATGEEPLSNLYKIRDDLLETGPLSASFENLQDKVRRLP